MGPLQVPFSVLDPIAEPEPTTDQRCQDTGTHEEQGTPEIVFGVPVEALAESHQILLGGSPRAR